MMSSSETSDGLDDFRRIDQVIAGVGFVDSQASDYIVRLQRALDEHSPLSLRIAEHLQRLRGMQVFLFTGFVVPQCCPQGENDGPLGTLALARMLGAAGLLPTIWVDPQLLDNILWLAAELGLTIPIRPIPLDGLPQATGLPAAAVAIEKPGRNPRGVMHTFDGLPIESGSVPLDDLFDDYNHAGVLTVGIGDRGNEIGFGALREEVLALRPKSACCRCPCGGGVVASTPTQLLLPAAVSNWGAYGLVSALSILLKDDTCLLDPREEERLLRVAAVRGCVDGVQRRGGYGVDGLSGETSIAVVGELQSIAKRAIERRCDGNACA
jgi:D-glutamate cyclase